MNKKIYLSALACFFFLMGLSIWTWGYVWIGYQEFQFAEIIYTSKEDIRVGGRPTTRLDRWLPHSKTDLYVTLRNESKDFCSVRMHSRKNEQSISLGSGEERVVILNRESNIPLSFCEANAEIHYKEFLGKR